MISSICKCLFNLANCLPRRHKSRCQGRTRRESAPVFQQKRANDPRDSEHNSFASSASTPPPYSSSFSPLLLPPSPPLSPLRLLSHLIILLLFFFFFLFLFLLILLLLFFLFLIAPFFSFFLRSLRGNSHRTPQT